MATLVLLVGIARGGARYFYCPMMGAASEDACCHPPHGARHDTPVIDEAACCIAKHLAPLPSVASSTPLDVASAPLAAALPWPARVIEMRPAPADVRVSHDARAGPGSPARRRSTLMIWTC